MRKRKLLILAGSLVAALLLVMALGLEIGGDDPVVEKKQRVQGEVQLLPLGQGQPQPQQLELPWKEDGVWYSTQGPPDGKKDSKGRTVLEFEDIDEYPPGKTKGKKPKEEPPVEGAVAAVQQAPLNPLGSENTVFQYTLALPWNDQVMTIWWGTAYEHPDLVGFLIWGGPSPAGPFVPITNWVLPHGPEEGYVKLVIRALGDWFVISATDEVAPETYEWVFTSPFTSPLNSPP